MIRIILLSDAGDFAAYLGAAFTLGLLIVAIFAYNQKGKNKGLKKIEDERLQMEKDKLNAEAKKRVFDSRPRFKILNQNHHGPNRLQLVLVNDGANAPEIKIEGGVKEGATWHAMDVSSNRAKNGELISIMVTSTTDFEGASFNLVYEDEDYKSYSQRIFKEVGNKFKIERVTMD
jgi:hypothetical protein